LNTLVKIDVCSQFNNSIPITALVVLSECCELFVIILRSGECKTESCCRRVSSRVDKLQGICLGTWRTETSFSWLDGLHGCWFDYRRLAWHNVHHGPEWRYCINL